MRKILTYAVSALALASCSSDSLVSDSPANTQAPIAFNVGQKNITRVVDDSKNLEKNGHTTLVFGPTKLMVPQASWLWRTIL